MDSARTRPSWSSSGTGPSFWATPANCCSCSRRRYSLRSAIDADEARDPDIGFVLARVRIDILVPVRYPGSVEVCIGIASAGRTTFSYACALFRHGRLAALSDATVAVRDRRTGAGHVLTPQFRAALTPMLLRAQPARIRLDGAQRFGPRQ